MEVNSFNSKALNLKVLENNRNKVTLGFKCNAAIKLTLAREAQQLGITLSEHVEILIMNNEQVKSDKSQMEKMNQAVDAQKKRIAFYENDILRDLFKKNKGRTIQYSTRSDKNVSLTVTEITDVYTILINSFKDEI